MQIFKDKEMEELKKQNPITSDFVTMISNMLNTEFFDDVMDGCYMLSTKDKTIAITNPEVMPFLDKGLTRVNIQDIKPRQGNLMGLGATWVNRDIFEKIMEALETYEEQYKIYINTRASFPLLITTPDGNISIAPVETFDKT